ncbi:MAG TPA: D-TA family PLP-dependent enzyme [Gemmataceae bacterium]|nr:D-TA family PLP-dependent enzyme [Gemmataceae bacterium]
MNAPYAIRDTSAIYSPALLFYEELIRRNIEWALAMAGAPSRLRPHVKTHKTREIVRLELEAGISKHKCATLAEAEMLAGCGVPDVLLAYNLVGPNCGRMARLAQTYPDCRFSVLADHEEALRPLSDAMATAKRTIEVLLDIDVGQHRTGLAPTEKAVALYESIDHLPGLQPGGLHVYDGHNHQERSDEREAAVQQQLGPVLDLRCRLDKKGLPVPRLVMGGTPTFPIFARMELPGLECAPGTCFLNDHGYGSRFADLAGFTPAALLLTRVISRPTASRVTLDLGYKAVASDPPAGRRLTLLDVPDYEVVLQNEEHLVIETPAAACFRLGDEVLAMPTHICPTCALHREAYVVENGDIVDRWEILARDRVLTI